jgi:DivIVA domain-containing protein
VVFWFQLAVVAVVLFGVGVVASGWGGGMAESEPDRPDPGLPAERPVQRADLDRLRLPVGFRGYRMQEVDAVLDRLATELEVRDAQIRELAQARSDGQARAEG